MSGSTDELQADIERLYALPLDQFTPARDELARRLRGGGDRDAAAEVKQLRKPNLPAWALNQVRHRDPSIVEELVVAGERLEQAQEQLVAGGAVRGVLQSASAEERRARAHAARPPVDRDLPQRPMAGDRLPVPRAWRGCSHSRAATMARG